MMSAAAGGGKKLDVDPATGLPTSKFVDSTHAELLSWWLANYLLRDPELDGAQIVALAAGYATVVLAPRMTATIVNRVTAWAGGIMAGLKAAAEGWTARAGTQTPQKGTGRPLSRTPTRRTPPRTLSRSARCCFFLCVRFFGSPFTQKSAKNASFFYKRVKVIFIVSSCDSTVCNIECALKFPVQRCPVFL